MNKRQIIKQVTSGDFSPEKCITKKCSAVSGYVKEINRRINVEKQNKELVKENALYQEAIDSLLLMVRDLVTPNFPAMEFLQQKLVNVPEVTQTHKFVRDEVINFYIITQFEDFNAEMKIADSIRQLISVFKNLRFDYMVIPKCDMNLDDIIPKDAKLIYSKREEIILG
jgi:hypothetical protein